MKIAIHISQRRRQPRGSVVLVALILLALMLVFVKAGSSDLFHLGNELTLIEKRQTARWHAASTNAVTTVVPPAGPESK